jgi:parafibromin
LPLITTKKTPQAGANLANNPSLALNPKAPASTRRPDPIILLSPSASSLLRLSNIKSFLEGGRYTAPEYMAGGALAGNGGVGTGGDGASGGSAAGSTANILHLSRSLRDIDPTRPMRFILVEGTEQFKPEYWNRVAAVFTTGQAWQFKSYKWSRPEELFRHVLGVYVGWRGDQVPESIRHWGPNVVKFEVDKWRDSAAAAAEAGYRDQLTVEGIWRAVERNMQLRGWRKDAGPTSI